MESMFLSAVEIISLTNYRRCDAQAKALRSMCIEHRIRPDGSLVVLREHVKQVFGVKKGSQEKTKRQEPNWAAINDPIKR